jgi:hypothetical protein
VRLVITADRFKEYDDTRDGPDGPVFLSFFWQFQAFEIKEIQKMAPSPLGTNTQNNLILKSFCFSNA